MSIKGKLNKMKNHLSTNDIAPPLKKVESIPTQEIPFLDKWSKLNSKPYFLDDEYSFIREVRYPLEHQHGRYRFNQLSSSCRMERKEPKSSTFIKRGSNE